MISIFFFQCGHEWIIHRSDRKESTFILSRLLRGRPYARSLTHILFEYRRKTKGFYICGYNGQTIVGALTWFSRRWHCSLEFWVTCEEKKNRNFTDHIFLFKCEMNIKNHEITGWKLSAYYLNFHYAEFWSRITNFSELITFSVTIISSSLILMLVYIRKSIDRNYIVKTHNIRIKWIIVQRLSYVRVELNNCTIDQWNRMLQGKITTKKDQ